MKKYLSLIGVASATLFFGCSNGNYIDLKNQNANEVLVNDFVSQAQIYYPPAQTTMQIVEPNNNFDKSLESLLRAKGYGVSKDDGKKITYKIDEWSKGYERATYIIDDCVFSRAYQISGAVVLPVGVWSSTNCQTPVFATPKVEPLFPDVVQPIKHTNSKKKKKKKKTHKHNKYTKLSVPHQTKILKRDPITHKLIEVNVKGVNNE